MSNNKNIPDMNQSWAAAEKMLDRHFRMKRLRKTILIISVPVLVIVFSLFFNSTKKTTGVNNNDVNSVQNESTLAVKGNSVSPAKAENNLPEQASKTGNNQTTLSSVTLSKANQKHPSNANSSSITDINKSKDSGFEKPENKIANSESVPVAESNTSNSIKKQSSGISTVGSLTINKSASTLKTPNSISPSSEIGSKSNKHNSGMAMQTAKTEERQKEPVSVQTHADIQRDASIGTGAYFSQQINSSGVGDEKSLSELVYLKTFASTLPVRTQSRSAENSSWPKKVREFNERKISWELAMLGGVHYINKSIESTNDWQNYLMHRRNEEDPVVAPSLGLAITASVKSFSLSVGAEYSVYGEKTNYYPYSLQPTITGSSDWQFYITNYVDTDTAYITGNQLFLQTIRQQQDSAWVTVYDTTETYKYDSEIAKKNGVNRFYYMEFPVEFSYCFTRGRTGFGVSGGVAPALLTNERGHYLRSDGKGVESFSEIKTFRKFLLNARVSADFYYRFSGRGKFILRPQLRTNLNSVFENNYGIKQKYYSTGVLFGVSYLLN